MVIKPKLAVFALALALALGSASVLANQPDSITALTSAGQLETAHDIRQSSRQQARAVRDDIDAYLDRAGLQAGTQLIGDSRVTVLLEVTRATRNPGERGFHTARRTAYQRAYLKALGDFLSQRAQTIENQLGSVFRDNSDNINVLREICTPNRAEAVSAKMFQLAEAMVDKALRELDAQVDRPAAAADFSCPAEQQLFRSVTKRRAAEALSGLRVVYSAEVDAQVGVVLVHSSRFEQAARQLLHAQGARYASSEDPLQELRDLLKSTLNTDTLSGTFGTRIMTAANGESVIVAFGMADPDLAPADTDRTIDRKFDRARRIAYNEAAAELARFARVNAVFSSESTSIDESARWVDLESGAVDESETIAERLLETVDTSSKLNVQGVTVVHQWESEEEADKQPLVGVVVAWSPTLQSTFGRDAARRTAPEKPAASAAGQHRARGAEMKEDW